MRIWRAHHPIVYPPAAVITECDFAAFLVAQTPKFDQMIIDDMAASDGWLLNDAPDSEFIGTPLELTDDRFEVVRTNRVTHRPFSVPTLEEVGLYG